MQIRSPSLLPNLSRSFSQMVVGTTRKGCVRLFPRRAHFAKALLSFWLFPGKHAYDWLLSDLYDQGIWSRIWSTGDVNLF